MADMFIRSETVSGMANTIRKITNTDSKINLGRFAEGEYEEKFYEGEGVVSGEPTDDIPDGYILPSGTVEIKANGNGIDVAQYAFANVNVPIPNGYLLPSGTLEIKENGTYPVADKAEVVVNVEGSKEAILITKNITGNGTYKASDEGADGYSSVTVAITEADDSPLPIEISKEAEMTALLSTAEVGSIYMYTGETGTYENGALYIVEYE